MIFTAMNLTLDEPQIYVVDTTAWLGNATDITSPTLSLLEYEPPWRSSSQEAVPKRTLCVYSQIKGY
jgi:hypothetical protein